MASSTLSGSVYQIGRTLNISDLNEVIALLERHHYRKASYCRLGQHLKLSHNTLENITKDHRDVHSCFTECLASWLRKADRQVENPTIDTLTAALREIGENAVADGIDGERQTVSEAIPVSSRPILASTRPTPQATPVTYTSEGHPTQPLIVNPGVDSLEQKIDQISELQEIANKLQGKYDSLALAVKKSLESNDIDVEDAKFLIKECLKRKARVVSGLMPCIDILEKAKDFKSFFDFLSKHDFIGYLNYKLLKKLTELVKNDNEINKRFFEYEEEYAKLLSAASFEDLIPFFERQSDLSPTAPLGLPYISFRLERPWFFNCVYTWISTFGKFSWSYYALLARLRENCVIITYAILPCVLDDVMRDLKDPVILKKLEDEGVTVIELPQEEEEDLEVNEGDPQIESTARIEPISRVEAKESSSIIQTTSSEGNIPTTSTTTLTSEANISQEVSLKEAAPIEKEAKMKSSSLTSEANISQEVSLKEAAPIEKEAKMKSSSLGRELLNSIKSHTKPEEVIRLLEAGADPNITEYYEHGDTPLTRAIKENNIDVFKLLLERGADPNIGSNTFGGTPLHCASKAHNNDIIKLLITKGNADVNAVDECNRTPLFDAIKSGSIEAVDILLTNGAKTDVWDILNDAPLHCASKTGNDEIIKLLITKGNADVNVANEYNRTPLFDAVKSGSIEAVDILFTNGARTDVKYFGTTLLHHAARETCNSDIVDYLIAKGNADVNALDGNKRTPLFVAVEKGNIEAVDILLTNGARTDVVDYYDSKTLLHYAGKSGKVEMLEFWIKRGDYDVNVLDKMNRTPLFDAVESGSIEAVDILLTNGARTDILDKMNRTPLFDAVESGSIEAVDILLTNGARTDILDKDGETLLHFAGKSGKVEMLEFWIRRDYDVNALDKNNRTPLFDAVKNGSIEAVNVLLTNGARTDFVDKSGKTLLHYASEARNADIVKMFISKGSIDVNAVDKYNRTALFYAVRRHSIEAVNDLLANGARTDIVDESGETILHYASETGDVDVVDIFLSKGNADVNAVNKRNRTPLFKAVMSGRAEVVYILLTNGARTDVPKHGETLLQLAKKRGKTDIVDLLQDYEGDVHMSSSFRGPKMSRVQTEISRRVETMLSMKHSHTDPILYSKTSSSKTSSSKTSSYKKTDIAEEATSP